MDRVLSAVDKMCEWPDGQCWAVVYLSDDGVRADLFEDLLEAAHEFCPAHNMLLAGRPDGDSVALRIDGKWVPSGAMDAQQMAEAFFIHTNLDTSVAFAEDADDDEPDPDTALRASAWARVEEKVADAWAYRKARAAFRALAMQAFDTLPDLQSFGWKQYLVDGDDETGGVLHVTEDTPDVNGIDGKDVPPDTREAALQPAVTDLLRRLGSDNLYTLFDEGMSVVVRRDGSWAGEPYTAC
jgi:hypothetical protein